MALRYMPLCRFVCRDEKQRNWTVSHRGQTSSSFFRFTAPTCPFLAHLVCLLIVVFILPMAKQYGEDEVAFQVARHCDLDGGVCFHSDYR